MLSHAFLALVSRAGGAEAVWAGQALVILQVVARQTGSASSPLACLAVFLRAWNTGQLTVHRLQKVVFLALGAHPLLTNSAIFSLARGAFLLMVWIPIKAIRAVSGRHACLTPKFIARLALIFLISNYVESWPAFSAKLTTILAFQTIRTATSSASDNLFLTSLWILLV